MKLRRPSTHAVCVLFLYFCSAAQAQNAIELFHKMQQALGGADKIASVRDLEQSVVAETWNANGASNGTVRKRVRWMRPNNLRLDQVGQGDTYVFYFNGTSGWEIMPDHSVADLAGGELKFAHIYLHDLSLNLWLADRDLQDKITSPAQDVLDISTEAGASRKIEITLDPHTFLPLKQSTISLADPSRPVPSESRFERWTTVEGIKFPAQTSVYLSGMRRAIISTEQTKLNSGLKPQDLSAKPSDLKPVMASGQ